MARRHTPDQVIVKVRQGQKILNAEQTRKVKELEKENSRLKKILAEKELAIDILNEVSRGKF